MRTTKTTPLRLWTAGQFQNPVGVELDLSGLTQYGVEGLIGFDQEEDMIWDERPIFVAPTDHILQEDLRTLINEKITYNTGSWDNYGIDAFISVLGIIDNVRNEY